MNGPFAAVVNRTVAVSVAPVAPYPTPPRLLRFVSQFRREKYWCWAAVAAAVARHYGRSDSQCSVATAVLVNHPKVTPPKPDCCSNPSGCDLEHDVEPALIHVGKHNRTTAGQMSLTDIRAEISNNRPVVIRVNFVGGQGHVATIYGFGTDAVGDDFVCLADPDRHTHPTDVNYLAIQHYNRGLIWTHSYRTQP